jgi:hypothetical protein
VPREELLERRLDKLEQSAKAVPTAPSLKDTQRLFEEFSKKTIKPLTDEIKRLSERVAALEKLPEQKPKLSSSALFGNDYKPTFLQGIPKATKSGSSDDPAKAAGLADKLLKADLSGGVV